MRVPRRWRLDLSWPYLVGLTVLVAIPLVAAIWLAFTDYTGLNAPRATSVSPTSADW